MAYLNVVKREIKRFYKRPLVWSFSLIIPLTMCLLICLIFSKGSPTNLPVAVLNKDNSEISRMLVRNLNTLSSCKVKYQVTSMQEANKLLTRGEIYAFLVIPKDFQKDIYKLKQPKLVFYYNKDIYTICPYCFSYTFQLFPQLWQTATLLCFVTIVCFLCPNNVPNNIGIVKKNHNKGLHHQPMISQYHIL